MKHHTAVQVKKTEGGIHLHPFLWPTDVNMSNLILFERPMSHGVKAMVMEESAVKERS